MRITAAGVALPHSSPCHCRVHAALCVVQLKNEARHSSRRVQTETAALVTTSAHTGLDDVEELQSQHQSALRCGARAVLPLFALSRVPPASATHWGMRGWCHRGTPPPPHQNVKPVFAGRRRGGGGRAASRPLLDARAHGRRPFPRDSTGPKCIDGAPRHGCVPLGTPGPHPPAVHKQQSIRAARPPGRDLLRRLPINNCWATALPVPLPCNASGRLS